MGPYDTNQFQVGPYTVPTNQGPYPPISVPKGPWSPYTGPTLPDPRQVYNDGKATVDNYNSFGDRLWGGISHGLGQVEDTAKHALPWLAGAGGIGLLAALL